MEFKKIIGEAIKIARKARKLTQAGVAKRAGIKRTYLVAIEAGRIDISVSMLKKITDAIGYGAHGEIFDVFNTKNHVEIPDFSMSQIC